MGDSINSKSENLQCLLLEAPCDFIIHESIEKAYQVVTDPKYSKIICAVSGGAIQIY